MNPFDYNNKPTPEMLEQIEDLRKDYKALYEKIAPHVKHITHAKALTKLEESAMWANKAITHEESNDA